MSIHTSEYETHEETVEGMLDYPRLTITITFKWKPDFDHLDTWAMWGTQNLHMVRSTCVKAAEDAATRQLMDAVTQPGEPYVVPWSAEALARLFRRESWWKLLLDRPLPFNPPDLSMTGIKTIGACSYVLTLIPEKPWELHIGDHDAEAVFLDDDDRVAHVQIIGASRFGKSKLVEYAVRQLVGKQGVVVIDPNEQLYDDLLTWCAHQDDYSILFLDPSDEGSDVGFNPFRLAGEKTPARITARASRLLKTALRAGKFTGGDAVFAERIMRVLFYVLIEQELPVTLLQAFMTPRLFKARDFIMAGCASQDIRDEWDRLTAGKKENAYISMMESSATRLVNLFMEPGVSRILTNPMQLNIPAIIENGGTVLVNLKDTPDIISREARDIIGTFLVDEVWNVIKGRSKEQAQRLPGVNLCIDEFHNFATPEFAMMLKEGGKYGLHMWLVNHALDDLDRDVQNALKACHTRIAFGGTSRKDAATVLEGSKPEPNRDLRDEIDRVPGLGKRQFILRRTEKRNEGCATPEVKTFPIAPEKLREYIEALTRAPKEETPLLENAEPEAIAESQTLIQNDSQEPAKPPRKADTPPRQPGEVETDDFYY